MVVQSKKELQDIILKRLETALDESLLKPTPLFGRVQIEIPNCHIMCWLKCESTDIKLYGKDRENEYEIAGLGAIDIITGNDANSYADIISKIRLRIVNSDPQVKYFGGISFYLDQPIDETWESFGQYYFLLPKFEIFKKEHQTYFAMNYDSKRTREELFEEVAHYLDTLCFDDEYGAYHGPEVISRIDMPSQEKWKEMVQNSIDAINEGPLEKLVLSRRSIFELSGDINPFEVIHELKKHSVDSFEFCCQPEKDIAFLGSTPELLFRRKGQFIASEAIAGTRIRGKTRRQDELLEEELYDSTKEKLEHQVVVEMVRESLEPLCEYLHTLKEMDILKLNMVQHLYSQFFGLLNEGVQDEDILEALHPTPAILGAPREVAFEELKKQEKLPRGWYAGPMGWIGEEDSTFVVGIRSGLMEKNRVTVFSGAGIVHDSHPIKEWDEIENKIEQFKQVFHADSEKFSAYEEKCK